PDALFLRPPLTLASIPVAWLPAPPVIDAKLLGCPPVSVHKLLTELVPGPARFEQPPVTLVKLLAAVLPHPPVTSASAPLAALPRRPSPARGHRAALLPSPATGLDPPDAVFEFPNPDA